MFQCLGLNVLLSLPISGPNTPVRLGGGPTCCLFFSACSLANPSEANKQREAFSTPPTGDLRRAARRSALKEDQTQMDAGEPQLKNKNRF